MCPFVIGAKLRIFIEWLLGFWSDQNTTPKNKQLLYENQQFCSNHKMAHGKILILCLESCNNKIYQKTYTIFFAHIFFGSTSCQVQCSDPESCFLGWLKNGRSKTAWYYVVCKYLKKKSFCKRSFGQKVLWSKGPLVQRSFGQKVLWPKGPLV